MLEQVVGTAGGRRLCPDALAPQGYRFAGVTGLARWLPGERVASVPAMSARGAAGAASFSHAAAHPFVVCATLWNSTFAADATHVPVHQASLLAIIGASERYMYAFPMPIKSANGSASQEPDALRIRLQNLNTWATKLQRRSVPAQRVTTVSPSGKGWSGNQCLN